MDTQLQELIDTALSMRKMSYTPYSHFNVGAALLGADGKIYTGCNIENASYTPTNCAERTAFFKAVSEGMREFKAIAIAGGKEDSKELDYCPPCGVCRQVMSEFCKDDFKIILVKSSTEYKEYTLTDLVPERFTPDNLLG
jgi:cytidine deaminase